MLIRVSEQNVVTAVRVVTGEVIAKLDKTGTLTHKYQAKSRIPVASSVLVSSQDTGNVSTRLFRPKRRDDAVISVTPPIHPDPRSFLPIARLYRSLCGIVGLVVPNPGKDQERNRAAGLHKLVCRTIGDIPFADTGQFPDIESQLLELKLQTAPTIDLGLVSPDSTEQLADLADFRHCDVRYGVFYGSKVPSGVRLDAVVLTTGEDFFSFFQRFEGMVRNAKLQIPLPAELFLQTE